MVARGVGSFGILGGATDTLIEYCQKFFVNLAQTYDEQMLKISKQYLGLHKSYDQTTKNSEKQMAYL